jgi:2-keto-4-pentenoate hydratase
VEESGGVIQPRTDHPAAGRDDAAAAAARRLSTAAATGAPCAPVRDLLGPHDIDLAYAVQRRLTGERLAAGARVTGRKIGLTSPAVQRQLGVDRPDFGVLFADMDVSAMDTVPSGRLLQPKAEAEIAFVLGADLDAEHLDVAAVRAAVDHAVAALEIVDSRIAGWDITITDTVADNASSGLYVLGDRRVRLDAFDPVDVSMRLYADGRLASEGTGAACLGDPLRALLWLARTARDHGDPLRAGQVILSGALGPMIPAGPGVTVQADISSLGSVRATFSGGDQR